MREKEAREVRCVPGLPATAKESALYIEGLCQGYLEAIEKAKGLADAFDKILIMAQIHDESECCLCAIAARNRAKEALGKWEEVK